MEEQLTLCLATLILQKKTCKVPAGQDVRWPRKSAWMLLTQEHLVPSKNQTRSLSHTSHSLATVLSYYGSLLLLHFTNLWVANHRLVSLSPSRSACCPSVLSYPLHLNKIPEVVLKATHWVWKESQTRLPDVNNVDSFDKKFGNSCHCDYDIVI